MQASKSAVLPKFSSSDKKTAMSVGMHVALERLYATLDADELEAMQRSDAMLDTAEKGEANGTFIKGDAVALSHHRVRKGKFAEWCRIRWPRDRSYAYRFMRVVDKLAPYRDRLVAARVPSSALLSLGSHPDRAVEVLAAFEAGRRLSVAQVRTMLRDAGATVARGEQGGTSQPEASPCS